MSSYQILCILCALALVTSVASSRLHKLQETVAITALALGMSLLLLLGGKHLAVMFMVTLWQGWRNSTFKPYCSMAC